MGKSVSSLVVPLLLGFGLAFGPPSGARRDATGASGGIAGTLSGVLNGASVTCSNNVSRKKVKKELQGSVFACSADSLQITSGDEILLRIVAEARGSSFVGGTVQGMTIEAVKCRNRTTGQTVQVVLGGATSWDCEAIGLLVEAGDVVQKGVVGPAD